MTQEELDNNLACLIEDLGAERVELLADLIREVMEKTGYGLVSIVINNRHVEFIKQEFNYK